MPREHKMRIYKNSMKFEGFDPFVDKFNIGHYTALAHFSAKSGLDTSIFNDIRLSAIIKKNYIKLYKILYSYAVLER